MNNFCFLDVELKLKDDGTAVITPAYFQGSIESSLKELFGEIGGQTELELVKFVSDQKRGIFKVLESFATQTKAAITLTRYKVDMSYSFKEIVGKDTVIFATKEDHAIPSDIQLPPPEPAQGLITKDGEINWGCPCLGGMATGPCGIEFREAFSCFHYSQAEPKGSDCYEAFRNMQDCFTEYPSVYNKSAGSGDDEDEEEDALNMTAFSDDIQENDSANVKVTTSNMVDK